MQYQKKIFCKGILCDKWNRKHKCVDCGVWVCGSCEIPSLETGKYYCPNCYLKTFSPDWDKMNKEFDEMLNKNKKVIEEENVKNITKANT